MLQQIYLCHNWDDRGFVGNRHYTGRTLELYRVLRRNGRVSHSYKISEFLYGKNDQKKISYMSAALVLEFVYQW